MNVTIERKKSDCSALPKGWQREEVLRKTGLSAGKVDVYYYSPSGGKVETKSKLMRQVGDVVDLSTFDYYSGRHQMSGGGGGGGSGSGGSYGSGININPSISLSSSLASVTASTPYQRNVMDALRRSMSEQAAHMHMPASSLPSPSSSAASISATSLAMAANNQRRGVRTDVSLVPPIRQTASIFKQPVTLHRNQDSKSKSDLKAGGKQEKPKQLFWEKRLEGLNACDMDGSEFSSIELPRSLKPIGPHVNNATLLQSVATALHVTSEPITGQTASKSVLSANIGAYLNPIQPLMHSVNISEDDIRRQEDRVNKARQKLQEASKC